MYEGHVKLFRKIIKSSFYQDSQYVHLWVHLLLSVNWTEKRLKINGSDRFIDLKPGQVLTSRDSLSKATGINSSKIERILKAFENEQQIEQQTYSKYRVISISNWCNYQSSEQQNEQQMNNKRTADEQQMNTNKNYKNYKNYKNESKNLSSSDDEASAEFYLTKRKRKLSGKRLSTFNEFWAAFNYKAGKAEAADAWVDIPCLTNDMVSRIVSAAQREASLRDDLIRQGKTPKMAQGWLSGRRWEDEDLLQQSDEEYSAELARIIKEAGDARRSSLQPAQ